VSCWAEVVRSDGCLLMCCCVVLGLGDDASDLGQQWEDWKDKAWPALCEQYAHVRHSHI
jgi:hypothetical protein